MSATLSDRFRLASDLMMGRFWPQSKRNGGTVSEYIVDESIISLLEDMLRTIESSDKWGYVQEYGREIDFGLREKITRCRDCMDGANDGTKCTRTSVLHPSKVEPDGFCKWGKPK